MIFIFQQKLLGLIYDYYAKPFLNHNSKYLILTQNNSSLFVNQISSILKSLSIANFAIMRDSPMSLLMDQTRTLESSKNVNLNNYFPKLKLGLNWTHSVFVYEQMPTVRFENGRLRTKFKHFLNAINGFESSKMNFKTIKNMGGTDLKTLHLVLMNLIQMREIEIAINTMIVTQNAATQLMTYYENGYYSVVPLPKKNSMAEIIFFKVKFKI